MFDFARDVIPNTTVHWFSMKRYGWTVARLWTRYVHLPAKLMPRMCKDWSMSNSYKSCRDETKEIILHSQECASFSESAAGLLPCCHQADIRMRSHCLLRLDDNTSAASCQQAWCKLIVKTFYPQAWCVWNWPVKIRLVTTWYLQTCCKLLKQLASSLRIKSLDNQLVAIWWSQQTCCNLLTTCSKPAKSTTWSKSVVFLAVY